MRIEIEDRRRDGRYDVSVDGKPAGLVTYRLTPDSIAFTHAEVDRAFEGKGVGSTLARHVLDDARSRGLAVLPDCPFIGAFVGKNPEYADLVPAEARHRYGLG